MKKTLATGGLLIAALALTGKEPEHKLVAHEWGTFTSVALDTGAPARWAPWNGPADLPCFVYRDEMTPKWSLSGTVRMETPVIYFYADQPMTLGVTVRFPKGMISEWYPKAENTYLPWSEKGPASAEQGVIRWNNVQVRPGAREEFPRGEGDSHYYPARATDATPLRVDGQDEKLLFYRGVGNFIPVVGARFPGDGKLEIQNLGAEPIPLAIAFENQGTGKIGYRVVRNVAKEVSIEPPALTQDVKSLHAELQRELVAAGLYEKEAAAMIATWQDSWFEEGTRVIYIMPRAAVDRVLPLDIQPVPAEVKRVFVGRVEVLSPWTEKIITTANAKNDYVPLLKFGRFLGSFTEQLKIRETPTITQARVQIARLSQSGCVN
jgi:hypothetical protein